jgi:hypothetical protein
MVKKIIYFLVPVVGVAFAVHGFIAFNHGQHGYGLILLGGGLAGTVMPFGQDIHAYYNRPLSELLIAIREGEIKPLPRFYQIVSSLSLILCVTGTIFAIFAW